MSQSANGRIQVSRNFAVGVAAVIIILAIATMFLLGMVVSENRNREPSFSSYYSTHTPRPGQRTGRS